MDDNNKKFAFVSDFDGTLTKKDFYQIIIDKYLGDKGRALYEAWRKDEHKDRDFLHKIYSSIDKNEDEIFEEIKQIEWDETATEFIKKVRDAGGDFIILSAGTNYYIDRLLKIKGIKGIPVYSNYGIYKDRGIHLMHDETDPYHSDRYGIDKGLVVKDLKEDYETLYFAGDSAPDIPPCKLADLCFATGKLKDLLKEEGISYIPFNCFKDIETVLIEKGVLPR